MSGKPELLPMEVVKIRSGNTDRERNKVCQSNGKPTARITFVGAQSDAEHPLVSPPTTFHLQYFHIGRKLPTEM